MRNEELRETLTRFGIFVIPRELKATVGIPHRKIQLDVTKSRILSLWDCRALKGSQ